VGAVAGDNVGKVLLVSERQACESYRASPWDALGPVDHSVISSPSTNTWVICRSPCVNTGVHGRRRGLGDPAVARDHVGRKDAVRDEPLAFAVEVRCDLVRELSWPWRQWRVVQHPCGGTGSGPRRRRRGRRSPRRPSAVPGGRRARARSGFAQDLRSRIGARAIASTSTSVSA
jgi:hypothetical protein